jgi:FtsP/CotA-like multicopper oxidase with cupredoxin domain
MPGDTVAAHLVNILPPRRHDGMTHGDADQNPTNLHYFHGGIVSPNNARPGLAELGTGDNIYVYLKAGQTPQGKLNSFDFWVPIPGENSLDARVLEKTGFISHPVGLNWYHSHLHGVSSDQVTGGMSGLLSVGEATANIIAACQKDPNDESKCLNDVKKDTADLKKRTKIRYALLRDMPLKTTTRPEDANYSAADWDPAARDFPAGSTCGAWDGSKLNNDDPRLRLGFCQRDLTSAWLFTVNGQRFPTITVEGGKNLLVRMGNLSANIGYWLELYNEKDSTLRLPITVISVDGVVPAKPVDPGQAEKPVQAKNYDNLLLMPASRIEFYVRNDGQPHTGQVYVLRTRRLRGIGLDEWPEIQLARIVLEPNVDTSKIALGLNALVAKIPSPLFVEKPIAAENEELPEGCVRDLNPALNEYRRVTFLDGAKTQDHKQTWNIKTEIVSPSGPDPQDEDMQPADPTATIAAADGILGVPFEDYERPDGTIDWTKIHHTCIKIDHASHLGSHKQLWVLSNSTTTLHNFHIHQMKFRLATLKELKEKYHILPPDPSHTCGDLGKKFPQPDYKCYDPVGPDVNDPGALPLWHDTIPIPPSSKVFVVMSFDAKEQIGRFVFHCHILKHEDKGLMAPIEVWEPKTTLALDQSTKQRSRK